MSCFSGVTNPGSANCVISLFSRLLRTKHKPSFLQYRFHAAATYEDVSQNHNTDALMVGKNILCLYENTFVSERIFP